MGIRVQKERIPIVVLTNNYRLEAEIHVVSGGRLIDEINKERDFIPLTNVTIYDVVRGTVLDTIEFMALNKSSVVFLAPTSPGGSESYGL